MTALTLAGTSGTAGGAWEGLLFAGYRGRGGGVQQIMHSLWVCKLLPGHYSWTRERRLWRLRVNPGTR